MPTNENREKNGTEKNCQPLLMENIERFSKAFLDREIPCISKKPFLGVIEHVATKNNFNAFLKEYDDDSLIFNISLTNKDTYISSLNKRFANKGKKVLLASNEKRGHTFNLDYCEYYINIIKNILGDILWVNELTSREMRSFQKKCFGEMVFSPSIDIIKDGNVGLMKNFYCFVFHVPGFLYALFEKDKCQRTVFVETDVRPCEN